MTDAFVPNRGEVVLRLTIEDAETIASGTVSPVVAAYARVAIEQSIARDLENLTPEEFTNVIPGVPDSRKPRKFVGGLWRD